MSLLTVDLADKYDLSKKRIFITGTQALIRLCLTQSHRDRKAGLNTAGYVTGYRGSPLGGLDAQFPRAKAQLDKARVIYEPALNEDLAATALWGAQQAEMRGEGAYDGVFGMWYGKGPGVDRSGDALRHANLAGSSRHGGVLVLMGDDHTCESSTTCHQSDYALMDAMIPVLNPASVAEILEYGLHGWALSRFSGLWVGLKCVKDNIESTASIWADPDAVVPVLPNFDMPAGGLNIRAGDPPQEQEARLHRHKVEAARAYARANGLDNTVWSGGTRPRIGIVSTGKSWMDVLSALQILGIDRARADAMGLALYKVGMSWPLEPEGISAFAAGLDQVIVVEEKRGLIEEQLRAILYGRAEAPRSILGKRDEDGRVLFQAELALNPLQIAAAVGARLPDDAARTAATGAAAELNREREVLGLKRGMYFCAGCPHNSSTVMPEGARGYAGIGCSWMSQTMDRGVDGYTHMGAEGANWIGESKFSTRRHVFQTLGDGTYNHSGLLAVRAAIAAKTNITYKILYNDTVAMTGGQDHEGDLSPFRIAAEVVAAGVARLAFVTDRPDLYSAAQFPPGTSIDHRDKLIAVQKDLARVEGCTVLLYEQTCAAEKRRRRKRGRMEDPEKRLFINPLVCEGCGDCGVQSNCVAITPLETEFGRKRQVDQSSCNKDYSCAKGFCPSFASVEGGALRKPAAVESGLPELQDPALKLPLDRPFGVVLTSVGGTGVVTIGALLAMAAHLEGKGCGIIDMLGMAQKGGAVTSHIMLAQKPGDITAIRVAPGQADLVLGCDMVVSAGDQILSLVGRDRSHLVVNTHEMMTGDFTRNADFTLPVKRMKARLAEAVAQGNAHFVDATKVVRALMGDTIAANLFMLGVAYQKGLVPLSARAIEKAIELNGVSVPFNLKAFAWGRRHVQDEALVMARAAPGLGARSTEPMSLDQLVAHRAADLANYQSAAYARRYTALVERVAAVDPGPDKALSMAVARNAYKLMAYKDEYEVARLYTDGRFEKALCEQFTGDLKLRLQMAPPIFSKRDKETGHLQKRTIGPWMLRAMKVLARMKGLRGTPLDPFGRSAERRMERALIAEYFATIEALLPQLPEADYAVALALASLPETIRGYGHVKAASVEAAAARRADLLGRLVPAASVLSRAG
ncbi:indolepyruvate ferredoxin oxidoreductase family protein [Defluviimonas sp. WL0075]|uniref:Indolepyruvate ferredoxin oxidoreductase family protein n=1 Tax=Albidovulum sediminicola TaxID=2984331 RepID=A0ABT2Z4R1_9RHOB|nr:indolepyruvate ferredoxin oxidoreductase family protein [Defluviimonas sp. WL0075]MCV2866128.1 indolepyruvate ferredoxin oxidoreductase family protein [Defluviimonas sp. WL0075]